MLQNYLKIAWRNLLKHKLFSALNIFGLATSMSVCLLLFMILNDQYSYDNFHDNGDRIYRVISSAHEKAIPVHIPDMATTSLALAEPLKNDFAFVENSTRLASMEAGFQIGDKILYADNIGYAVDASFLDMFSFGWLEGNQETALSAPRSIVLTEEVALKFFPKGNALGQIVEYGQLGQFTITGIMPDPPIRSHIYFDYLLSYETITAMTAEDQKIISIGDENQIWRGLVYVLLDENAKQNELDDALAAQANIFSARDEKLHYLFQSQALADIMPTRDLGNEIGTATPAIVLYFLMSLGFLLMIAACFNYMNLSIARSLKRSKEIGIRKVIGAGKKDIIFQFLGEAILIAFLSLLVALVLLELLIPAFYGLDPFVEQCFYLTRSPLMYLGFFGFSLLIGLLAGAFPAFNISAFQPIQSLQQLSNIKLFSKVGIRKALITAQFTLSLIFILIVSIVLQQHKHVLNADLGIRTDNLMNVWMNKEVDIDVFTQQVSQIKGVEAVTSSSTAMLVGGTSGIMAHFKNNTDSMKLGYNSVAQNFIDFMHLQLIAGENFPKGSNTESEQFIILNETAVKRMGHKQAESAIGEIIMLGDDGQLPLKVIGVTRDFHHGSIWWDPVQPFALRQGANFQNLINIRLSETNTSATVAAIHELWNGLSPKQSINSYFTDTRMYHLDKFFRMGSRIIGFIGFLTILISCMGLLGMVIYTVEGRLKEVGIRKVLGASEGSIHWQLSKGFLLLLCIAILIAVPLTIFVGNLWLQNFVLHTSVSPWMILSGVGLMLGLALVTVASQTLVAVKSNPAEVLKVD